jgi:hypothetical protein
MFLGHHTLQCCCQNLICIVIVRNCEKIGSKIFFNQKSKRAKISPIWSPCRHRIRRLYSECASVDKKAIRKNWLSIRDVSIWIHSSSAVGRKQETVTFQWKLSESSLAKKLLPEIQRQRPMDQFRSKILKKQM